MRPIKGIDAETFKKAIVGYLYEEGDYVEVIDTNGINANTDLKLGKVYEVAKTLPYSDYICLKIDGEKECTYVYPHRVKYVEKGSLL